MDYTISREDLEELPHKDIVKFALFCANQVEEHWRHDMNALECIHMVKLRLDNKITAEECIDMANLTCQYSDIVTYGMTQRNAVRSAMFAAYTAGCVDILRTAHYAYLAALCVDHTVEICNIYRQKIIEEQWYYYNKLNTVSNIFEKIVLEGG